MSPDVQQIVNLLPHLSKEDLLQVHKAVGACLSLNGHGSVPAKDEVVSSIDPMLVIISKVLQSRGLEFSSPYMLSRSNAYTKFRVEHAPAISKFFEAQGLSHVEQALLLDTGIRLLIDRLQARGMSVSGRTLLWYMHQLPSTIDQAFPGYASAGLLSKIIHKEKI
jgi:hypothetical protein